MTEEEVSEWSRAYFEAKNHFRQSEYRCFNERPLTKKALEYSAGDVDVIEKLYDVYLEKMNEQRWAFVCAETDARVALSLLEVMPQGSSWAPDSIESIVIDGFESQDDSDGGNTLGMEERSPMTSTPDATDYSDTTACNSVRFENDETGIASIEGAEEVIQESRSESEKPGKLAEYEETANDYQETSSAEQRCEHVATECI
jgi:hypothetical protein